MGNEFRGDGKSNDFGTEPYKKKNANKKNVLTCVTRNKEGGTYGNCNSNGNKQRALLEGEQANLIVSCSRLQPHSSLSES